MTTILRWMMTAAGIAATGALAAESVEYYDPVGGTNATCSVCSVYTVGSELSNGWYVVAGVITNENRIFVSGDVNLILRDNSELVAIKGVNVGVRNSITYSLTIWAQSTNSVSGKLTATGGDYVAGIGGRARSAVGIVTINGGVVTAIGGYQGGAGIGGGVDGSGGTVTINGGVVAAIGGDHGGAGIGGGAHGSGGTVTINGGMVTVTGKYAAGIGGYSSADDGELSIPGMKVGYVNGSGEVEDWTAVDSRMDACRNRDGKTVRLEVCDSHVYENGSCRYCGAAEPIGISGVMAERAMPDELKVKIRFTVSGNPALFGSGWESPRLLVTATDTATGETHVAAPEALSETTATYAGEHTVFWDMSGVLPEGFSSTGMVFTVAYLNLPDYCVIDLSGIPAAPKDLSSGIDGLTETELRIASFQVENDITTEEGAVSNLVAQIADFDAQLAVAEGAYNDAGYTNAGLAQLEKDVKGLMAQEAAARQLVVDDPGKTYLSYEYYENYARPLAKAMLKYYLVHAGEVSAAEIDSVYVAERFNDNVYSNKHFCVRYIKSQEGLKERYFDYVTCDNAGNPLIKKYDSDKSDDAAADVAGIVVLEKVPTYAYWEGDDNTKLVAVEATSANIDTYQAQKNEGTMKSVTVCGTKYLVAQRNGWSVAPGASPKGALRVGLNAAKEAVNLTKAIEDITAAKTALSDQKSAAETKLSGLDTLLVAITDRLAELRESGAVQGVVCPASYLDAPPENGWTDAYKTSNIVMRLVAPETSGARPFYCAVFETTQRQWELVTGGRPSYFTNETCYAMRPVERISYDMLRGKKAGAQWPATNSVDDASFLGVLRAMTGLAFDLPTEAQWEFACRAGTATDYNNGENIPKGMAGRSRNDAMNKVGRYWFNGGEEGKDNPNCTTESGTAEVGSFPSNAWGLYDMHGNVWEWCLDWRVDDPSDPGYHDGRVIRGGAWREYASYCTSSMRLAELSECAENHYGLRLVLPIDGSSPAFGSEICAGASKAIRVGNPATVSNVVARQRWPWNGLVDVDYDVSGNTAGLKAEIAFVEQGGESRTWTATKFAAGFEPSAEPGHHRATWDTKADGATNIVAKVKAMVRLVCE